MITWGALFGCTMFPTTPHQMSDDKSSHGKCMPPPPNWQPPQCASPWVHAHYSVDSLMWTLWILKGPSQEDQQERECMEQIKCFVHESSLVPKSHLTMSVLCGDARQAQLASFSLFWVTRGAVGECSSSSRPCLSRSCCCCFLCGQTQKRAVSSSCPSIFFLKNPSPRDYSVKLLKQQLDFLWKKVRGSQGPLR